MGTDRRRPHFDDKKVTPGPGYHNVNSSAFSVERGRHIGQKLGPDEETRLRIANPGPGAYNQDDSQLRTKQPGYSMGAKHKSEMGHYISKAPGPGNYDSHNVNHVK